MIPIIENTAILALYTIPKPVEQESVAPQANPGQQFVRAPVGGGHEAALQQKGGTR